MNFARKSSASHRSPLYENGIPARLPSTDSTILEESMT